MYVAENGNKSEKKSLNDPLQRFGQMPGVPLCRGQPAMPRPQR